MELEQDYIRMNLDNGLITVIAGLTGSGKTCLFISYLKLFLPTKTYKKYFLVLPEIDDEKDDKYKFLRTQKDVTIYKKYDMDIIDEVKKECKKHRVFLGIDDSTSIMYAHKFDDNITLLSTTSRHGYGTTVFLMLHSFKNILLPHIRAMISFTFFGLFTNVKLLKSFWEENLSLLMEWDDFIAQYKNEILAHSKETIKPFVYVNRNGEISFDVRNWELVTHYKDNIKANGKARILSVNKDISHIRKLQNRADLERVKNTYEFGDEKKKPSQKHDLRLFKKSK